MGTVSKMATTFRMATTVVFCVTVFGMTTATLSREDLKEMGLSPAVPDRQPIPPPVPGLQASGSVSWCDIMEEDEGWFKCADRKDPWCIHPVLKCNNEDDCQDGSDEKNCATEAPPQDHRPYEYYCYDCTPLQWDMLEHHNNFRALETAANMNELNWSKDDELAAEAQAKLCRVPDWGENPHGNMEPDYGQNVARYYYPGELTNSQILDMITWWYEEKGDYDYAKDTCAAGKKCGHYTAMVSAYERNVGCSLQKCNREKDGETREFWNLVCNYSIWPNWKVWQTHPSQPFMQGQKCSKCQPGLQCRKNLCA